MVYESCSTKFMFKKTALVIACDVLIQFPTNGFTSVARSLSDLVLSQFTSESCVKCLLDCVQNKCNVVTWL